MEGDLSFLQCIVVVVLLTCCVSHRPRWIRVCGILCMSVGDRVGSRVVATCREHINTVFSFTPNMDNEISQGDRTVNVFRVNGK